MYYYKNFIDLGIIYPELKGVGMPTYRNFLMGWTCYYIPENCRGANTYGLDCFKSTSISYYSLTTLFTSFYNCLF